MSPPGDRTDGGTEQPADRRASMVIAGGASLLIGSIEHDCELLETSSWPATRQAQRRYEVINSGRQIIVATPRGLKRRVAHKVQGTPAASVVAPNGKHEELVSSIRQFGGALARPEKAHGSAQRTERAQGPTTTSADRNSADSTQVNALRIDTSNKVRLRLAPPILSARADMQARQRRNQFAKAHHVDIVHWKERLQSRVRHSLAANS